MMCEIEKTQSNITQNIDKALQDASTIITRDYLDKLEKWDIIPPSEEVLEFDIEEFGKFFQLKKLVVNREENFLDKVTTIVNVASSIRASLVTVIKSDGYNVEYYLGIISKQALRDNDRDCRRRNADAKAFQGALIGNLVGSDMELVSQSKLNELKETVLRREGNCYSAVSGIVGLRDKENKSIEGYVQGIENLVDAVKGQKYTAIMIADPLDTTKIQVIKRGYEMLHTQLATLAKSTLTLNQSDTRSLANAQTAGVAEGISQGIALTQSKTQTEGTSTTKNVGLSASIVVVSANVGSSSGRNTSVSDTAGHTSSTTNTRQTSRSTTNTSSEAIMTGKNLQLTYENRSVKALLDKIDKHLERLDECDSFGAFDCATYVIAEDRETSLAVASNYNAIMRGQDSSVQASHINTWTKVIDRSNIGKYLNGFTHPRFRESGKSNLIVTPASVVSGDEIAIQVGLPKKSVSGITVVPMAPFGRNLPENSDSKIELGNLCHMGREDGNEYYMPKVSLNTESLSMHTFITGSTGSGKSNAVYQILSELTKKKVTFLVVEPAKGEYKNIFGNRKDINVFGTNARLTPMLKINPFKFPDDIHVLEHIDRLIEIFNVCWPMYAAMPAVLKDAVERAYVIAGWDLDTSENKYFPVIYPCFTDVLSELHSVISESDFSEELKGNYTGALITRVKSMTNGINGQIFSSDEIGDEVLFDNNCIVDLNRVSSPETKALIMGMLIMKLQEHRMSQGGMNKKLHHITVLEEAHNLLRRTSTEQSSESSNLLGKSVEMLSQSIAEMRTYGEGFIIADQSPNMLDMSVIRNTNTKIILRLPDMSDRELCGRAANLNDEQIIELAKLPTGVSAVYQNNWIEPVLCKISKFNDDFNEYIYDKPSVSKGDKGLKQTLVRCLLCDCAGEKVEYSIDDLRERIMSSDLNTKSKIQILETIKSPNKTIDSVKNAVSSLFNTEKMLDIAFHSKSIEEWNDKLLHSLDIESLSETYKVLVVQCILKKKGEIDKDVELMYSKWYEFCQGGRVK